MVGEAQAIGSFALCMLVLDMCFTFRLDCDRGMLGHAAGECTSSQMFVP